MIFLLDNYDSFTYNLYQQLLVLGTEVQVARNDTITVAQVRARAPDAVVISPGPGRPENSGILLELIGALKGNVPMLGVCLGMQAIGMNCGGEVIPARNLMHGKVCQVKHDGRTLFKNLPSPLCAMRYHSLALDPQSLAGSELEESAWADDGELMGLRCAAKGIESVQFHPESFATEHGGKILENFLSEYVN